MEKEEKCRAIFMDRDGTISEEVGYVNHLSRFRLLPRTAEAIRLINKSGFKAIVVTNQSGVARGYFPELLVREVHTKMQLLLSQEGAHVDRIYYCPHHPQVGPPQYRIDCDCRKPKIGMLEKAARDLKIDLSTSYIIGDKHTEVIMGHRAGIKSILVLTGYGIGEYELYGDQWEQKPDFVAEDLLAAVKWILQQELQEEKHS
ncbi:MAG: HAD family hydrolase [bacterium]|nr:HAD family hydrolase [bacterium]